MQSDKKRRRGTQEVKAQPELDSKENVIIGQPDLRVGDEIIITKNTSSGGQEFKEGVWIVRSLESSTLYFSVIRWSCSDNIVLQRHYNNFEMLVGEDRTIRPKKFKKEDLIKSLTEGTSVLVTAKRPSNTQSLQELCACVITRELKRSRRSDRNLPTVVQEVLRASAADIAPIPIEYRLRQLAESSPWRIADSARMRKLTSPGASEWAQRAWRFVPESLSYFAIWRACAEALQASKPELPEHTAATFWMEPVGGPAAAMRGYLEACRRGDGCFELVFEHAWAIDATVYACTPRGPMKFGAGWR
jgi:hypothetical protein